MKNKLIIATDLDGTFYKIKPLMAHLDTPFYVITGCQNKEIIEQKLKGTKYIKYFIYTGKFNEDLDIYLRDIAVWKAKMVKKLKADIYIDDDHRVLREVSKLGDVVCLEVL